MLLSVKYDGKYIRPLRIEPGEVWDEADFFNAADNPVYQIDTWIWLILGWDAQYIDGKKYAVPVPSERLEKPIAYMVFQAIKPGKGQIVWDPLPEPAPLFFRRAEALVTIGDCDWDILDWYKSSPNSTGQIFVDPGYALVTGH